MKYRPNRSAARPLKIVGELREEFSFSSFFSLSDVFTLYILSLRHRKSPHTDALCRWNILSQFFFHAGVNRRNWTLIPVLLRSGQLRKVKNW